jgi:hypothetical protein
MQRISIIEVDDTTPYARELFENDDAAEQYWLSLLNPDTSVIPCLPCGAVMVIREEMFKGTWVETCRKLVSVRD